MPRKTYEIKTDKIAEDLRQIRNEELHYGILYDIRLR
jgi:hypothetical protein